MNSKLLYLLLEKLMQIKDLGEETSEGLKVFSSQVSQGIIPPNSKIVAFVMDFDKRLHAIANLALKHTDNVDQDSENN